MTRIILSGCNGKMGQVITRLCADSENAQIVAGIDINDCIDNGYPVFASASDCDVEADVIIDFSHPSVLSGILDMAKAKKIPAVICTTGLSEEQKKLMDDTAEEVGIFFSANMSLGINLLIALAKKATAVLSKDFDIEIVEMHHNRKLDAPSGTALAIADAISEDMPESAEYMYDRHSVRRKRNKNEIGIHAVRGGTIVGKHSVIFAGQDEIIEIAHEASSREIFANGAINAAKFMKGKPAGKYSMDDLIGAAI